MADPQIENGHIDIANDLVKKFCSFRISGREWQILWTLWSKTWGWKEKEGWITLRQFSDATGIQRNKCQEIMNTLIDKKIVSKECKVVPGKGNKPRIYYRFNKDFDKWRGVPEKGNCSRKRDLGVPEKGTTIKACNVLTKETLPKKPRKTSCPKFEERHLELARHLSRLIRKRCPKNITITPSQGPQWANVFRLMETRDGEDGKGIPLEEIKAVIDWAFADNFWYAQIQSAHAVRKHWNQLLTQSKIIIKKKVSPTAIVDRGPDKTQLYLEQAKAKALSPEEREKHLDRVNQILKGHQANV